MKLLSSPRMVAAATAVAMLVAACGGTDEIEASSGGDSAVSAPAGDVLEASVLSGEAITATGDTFDLGTLADKDLVVWFWAPW